MFDFLKKKPKVSGMAGTGGQHDSDDPPGLFQIEWQEFSSQPGSGKRAVRAWADAQPIFERFLTEPPASDAFVILAVSPQTYLQVARNHASDPPGSLILEHQVGSTDRHFTAAEPVTPALVADIAEAYLLDPDSIGKMCAWAKLDI